MAEPCGNTPALSIRNGHPVVTSLRVAESFGKRHNNVLKAIRALPCSPEFRALNFEQTFVETPIPNGATRRDTIIEMTRDGFTIIAMGFTGKDAVAWKERYIAAFNAMEAKLRAQELDRLVQRDTSGRVRTAADDPGLIPTRREPLRDIPKPRCRMWMSDDTAEINRRAHDLALQAEADIRARLRAAGTASAPVTVTVSLPEDAIPDSALNLLATRLVESVVGRMIPRPIPAGPRSPAVVSILSLPDGWLTFDPDDFKVVPGADYLVIGPDATLDITPLLPCDLPRHGVMVLPDRPGSIRRYVRQPVPIIGRVIRRVWL